MSLRFPHQNFPCNICNFLTFYCPTNAYNVKNVFFSNGRYIDYLSLTYATNKNRILKFDVILTVHRR